MSAKVTHLFVKRANGTPVEPVSELTVSPDEGILGGVPGPKLRQVLMLSRESLDRFDLKPGQLKENILIEGCDVQLLESGTVLSIGTAKIGVNFHCEVCHKIKDIANTRQIQHQRGVLGTVVTEGIISVGDEVREGEVLFEPVPYDIAERIRWYFARHGEPIEATRLVQEIGLSQSYCRALPAYLKRVPEHRDKVIFKSGKQTFAN